MASAALFDTNPFDALRKMMRKKGDEKIGKIREFGRIGAFTHKQKRGERRKRRSELACCHGQSTVTQVVTRRVTRRICI
jgi:hypothetical protein